MNPKREPSSFWTKVAVGTVLAMSVAGVSFWMCSAPSTPPRDLAAEQVYALPRQSQTVAAASNSATEAQGGLNHMPPAGLGSAETIAVAAGQPNSGMMSTDTPASAGRVAVTQEQLNAWGIQSSPAADAAGGTLVELQEAALQVASDAKGRRTVATSNALAKVSLAFASATDSETKQNLLVIAGQLAVNSGEDIRSLLKAALASGQPLEVQRQALYLASSDEVLLNRISSIAKHPLADDAKAFLINLREPPTASGK